MTERRRGWRLLARRDPATGQWVWVRQVGSWDALAAQLRRVAIEADDGGHDLREWAFRQWKDTTVYPAAVNRLIEQIGGRA